MTGIIQEQMLKHGGVHAHDVCVWGGQGRGGSVACICGDRCLPPSGGVCVGGGRGGGVAACIWLQKFTNVDLVTNRQLMVLRCQHTC